MIDKGIHDSAIIEFRGDLVLPDTTIIEPLVAIYGGDQASLVLGEMNIIYPSSSIRIDRGFMTTGCNVSFGSGCHIYEPRSGLTIGNNVMIAGGTLICGVEHGHARVDIPMREQPATSEEIVIEDDVWIGMGATISGGVRIGEGSIIGAGSVVTSGIPPYSVAYGVPCRVIRERD